VNNRARSLKIEVVIRVLGVVLALGTIVAVAVRFSEPAMLPMLPVVGAFFVAIVVGEMFRVELPGSRHTAPMATAAALAFAMTVDPPSGTPEGYESALVIAVTAVAMVVGSIPNVLRGRPVRLPDLANRLIGIAVAALLFRQIPVSQGRAVLDLQANWPPYLLAFVMVLVSALALTVQVFLLAFVRAGRSRAPFARTLEDEFRAAFGLTAALSATGTLIALAERPLGIVAIPLFLFPLVLTQFAVRRHSVIRRTYRQTIRSLSQLTEFAGYTEPGHASRVAELSKAMGHELGMSERDVLDLEYAALLHDIGQVSLTEPIPGGATVLAAPADQRRIAHVGAEIVRQTGVRELGEDLPLSSRIIKVCNAYDDLTGEGADAAQRHAAIERIHLGLGYEYDPRVVDALIHALSRDQ